jgi:hypothetical protein
LSKAVKGHYRPLPANSLYLQTLTSPSVPPERGLILFSVAKMSESVEGQPGDVRSPSFYFHQPCDPVPYCRESPHLRNQLGHSSSNRAPHTFLRLLNLLISLRSIANFSGDLSSLTAPPFILSPVSLTEFPGAPPTIYLKKHRAHYITLVGLGLQRTGASVQSSSPQYRKAKHQRIAPAVFSNGSSVHSRANTPHVTKRWVQRRSQSCYFALYTDGPLTDPP